jgi:hypothetical protein
LQFEFENLLDASYNVWHRLSDEEKISLANFLEELNQESNHVSFKHSVDHYDMKLSHKYSINGW